METSQRKDPRTEETRQNSWFKKLELREDAVRILGDKKRLHLNEARKKAIVWHKEQKAQRMIAAKDTAGQSLSILNLHERSVLEIALAMFYLGEGFKKTDVLGLGNSDPLIVKFFLRTIIDLYRIDISKVRCALHLRADQNPEEIKKYWSNELKIPIEQFLKTSLDKRTLGKPTYPDYKGVCIVTCGNVAIQRKLVYLSRSFCEKITSRG